MAQKRIGRPPKPVEDRKATHFTFRTRGVMRERLQAAAAASERSISEEIENRLDRSFQRDERDYLFKMLTGGEHSENALHMIAEAIRTVQTMYSHSYKSKGWSEQDSAEMLRTAVNLILARWGGLPERPPKDSFKKTISDDVTPIGEGRRLATLVLEKRQSFRADSNEGEPK
jgi:Arc-like DNA binding domain